jgi:hypothetical protein
MTESVGNNEICIYRLYIKLYIQVFLKYVC